MRRVDLEAPRQARRTAEQLLVEVVAEAAERLRERDAGRRAVQDHEQRHARAPSAYDGAERTAEQGAVDAEAALLDERDLPEMPENADQSVTT